jgi:murein DD-endopeptidase MepM/ murein hydrolase activator NlpD
LQPVEPDGLYTLFSDHLGDAELIQWGISFSTDRDTFSGEQSIRASSAYGGSGLLFHLPEVMNSSDYGALTLAVKSNITNLVITPYLETPNGVINTHLNVADYVYGDITDEWKVAWIPFRDLTGPATAAIANIYLEFSQAGVVWLDEVKVVRGLEFPLKNGWTPWTADISSVFDHSMGSPYGYDGQVTAWTGEVGAGTPVDSGCYPNVNPGQGFSIMGMYVGSIGCRDKLNYDGHPGIDYVVTNVPVNPAAPGKIMSNQCWTYNAGGTCASWGAVGVDHDNGFITQYWYMRDIQVQPGQTVTTDTVLGTASDVGIPGALHLHFEVAKRVGSTYVHVDPYGWAGSFDTDPYTKARNVCLWQTGCP